MKRINIHVEEETLKELDKTLKKIHTELDDYWSAKAITRADLIRWAIGNSFGLDVPWAHVSQDSLTDFIIPFLKKKVKAKK